MIPEYNDDHGLDGWTTAIKALATDARAERVGTALGSGELEGWLYDLGSDAAEGWLITNRRLIGARVADALGRRIAARAARDRADMERADRMDRVVVARSLGETLGRDDLPALEIPAGWLIDGRALVQLVDRGEDGVAEVRVSHRAMIPTGKLLDEDTGARSLHLEWPGERTGDPWGSTIALSSDTQDPRSFLALRNLGAPVSGRNARDLAIWLDAFEAANADAIPVAHHSHRLGWQGPNGALGYLWGRVLLSADGDRSGDLPPSRWGRDYVRLAVPADDGRSQIADGCSSSGTLDGWREVIARVLPYPRALLSVYASLASCLLGLVPSAPNAIVDWSGETSRGKTTTLSLAASCWGRPEITGAGVMRTWDVSPAALESIAEMCSHMPLILDDTKRATTRDDRATSIVSSIIYQVAAGQGRGRGKPDGMRRTATWRTVLLSTGEAPATSWTQDAGARARVLAIRGSPFPDGSGAVVAEIAAGVRQHYGHAGPALVRWLLSRPDAGATMRQDYDRLCSEWAAKAGGGAVGGRLAQILALLHLGADALHDVLGMPRPEVDPLLSVALPAVVAGSIEADRPTAALRAVFGWATSHASEFWGRHIVDREGAARQPTRGWAGAWASEDAWSDLAFLPGCLARVLRHEGGFDANDILPRWLERGWLVPGDGAHVGPKRRIDGERPRCYILRRSAFDDADKVAPGGAGVGPPVGPG
jgi:putative DNA primase/helicase